MDTVNGIPALEDDDPASLIGKYSRDLRNVLRAETITLSNPDEDKIDNYACQCWRFGFLAVVRISIRVTSSFSTGDSVGILPIGYRPPTTMWDTGTGNNRDAAVQFRIQSDGQLSIRGTGNAVSNWIQASAAYPLANFPT